MYISNCWIFGIIVIQIAAAATLISQCKKGYNLASFKCKPNFGVVVDGNQSQQYSKLQTFFNIFA